MLAALLISSKQHAIRATYDRPHRCIHVRPSGEYLYQTEVHRFKTPFGTATISVENDPFTGYYKGVDTSPEGYALAVEIPTQIAFELRLPNNDWLDHLTVDGRVIQPPDPKRRCIWTVRLRGGEHFVEIAWKPTE